MYVNVIMLVGTGTRKMNCGIIWQSQVTIPYYQNIYKYYTLPLLAATNWPQTHHPILGVLESMGSKPWKPRWKWWWPKFGPFSQRCVLLKTPICYSKVGRFFLAFKGCLLGRDFFAGPGNLVVAYLKVIISRFFWGPYFCRTLVMSEFFPSQSNIISFDTIEIFPQNI